MRMPSVFISQVTISSLKDDDACLAWIRNGDRYHIWFDPRVKIAARGVLYKRRAMVGGTFSDRVKHLSPLTKFAKKMIAEATLMCERYDMIAKAREDRTHKAAAEHEKRLGATRKFILEKHGPELWDTLLLAEEVLRHAPVNGKGAALGAILGVKEKVRAALDNATTTSL